LTKLPTISVDPGIQRFYEAMRARGESHFIAEMCALRQSPGTNYTDQAFMEGIATREPFEHSPEYAAMAKRKAKAAGVSTAGKRYFHSLAECPGDPKAWVGDTGEMKRRIEQIGFTHDDGGLVNVKRPKYQPEPKKAPVRESIVQREMAKEIARNPGLVKKKNEVREKVVARLSGAH
jgi:hypothetical protein